MKKIKMVHATDNAQAFNDFLIRMWPAEVEAINACATAADKDTEFLKADGLQVKFLEYLATNAVQWSKSKMMNLFVEWSMAM